MKEHFLQVAKSRLCPEYLNAMMASSEDTTTYDYDVALLRLDEPIRYQANIIPICLPQDDSDFVGETAWVTGWGSTFSGNFVCTQVQKHFFFTIQLF